MTPIEIFQGYQQPCANSSMKEVVLGTHYKFTIDDFVEIAVLRKRLEFCFRPNLPRHIGSGTHISMIKELPQTVEMRKSPCPALQRSTLQSAAPRITVPLVPLLSASCA